MIFFFSKEKTLNLKIIDKIYFHYLFLLNPLSFMSCLSCGSSHFPQDVTVPSSLLNKYKKLPSGFLPQIWHTGVVGKQAVQPGMIVLQASQRDCFVIESIIKLYPIWQLWQVWKSLLHISQLVTSWLHFLQRSLNYL